MSDLPVCTRGNKYVVGIRRCKVCKKQFPATTDFFSSNGKKKSGKRMLRPECKECHKAMQREKYDRQHPDAVRKKNGEKRCATCENWFPSTVDFFNVSNKCLKSRCKECENALHREWYREVGHEYSQVSKAIRRTRIHQAGGTFTKQQWGMIKETYGNRCLCCGRSDVKLTPDHVIPLAKGGTNDISNIQPLCLPCNLSKWAKIVDYRIEPHPQDCTCSTCELVRSEIQTY